MKNHKTKNYLIIILLALFMPVLVAVVPFGRVNAETGSSDGSSNSSNSLGNSGGSNPDYAILNPGTQNGISYLLKLAVRILTGLVAVAAVASIIYAGVQYASAGDDSSKVKAAKDRMTQTVIGIILYMLMYVILEFLIPGGAFK